jgi:hypothetical protein
MSAFDFEASKIIIFRKSSRRLIKDAFSGEDCKRASTFFSRAVYKDIDRSFKIDDPK